MRRLFQFKVSAQDSLACRLLVLPSCRHAYRQMVDALQYPTLDRHALPEHGPVLRHLQQVEDRGMDLAIEIQARFDGLTFTSANLSVVVQCFLPILAVMFLLEVLATLGISRQLESGFIYIPYRF